MQPWAHFPGPGPSQLTQISQGSLLLWTSVTCTGPTRRGGRSPYFGLWSTQLFWVKLTPPPSPPLLYKRGNGPWTCKHMFPALLWEPSLTLPLCLASGSHCWGSWASLHPSRREKRHEAAWPSSSGWGSPSATAIFPAAVTSPGSVTQSGKKPISQLLPPGPASRPWVGRPPSPPLGTMITWRRPGKPEPI